MAIQNRVLLTRSKADIEIDVASAGEHATERQRSRQAGVDSAEATTPPPDRPPDRQLHAMDRMPATSPTPASVRRDHLADRYLPNPLRSPRVHQRSQKERDVDRIET
jgi:hypothetical protein